LSFDAQGNVLKSNSVFNSWESIVESSHKILSILDTPGLDKYPTNNLQGLLSAAPDYCILVISPLNSPSQIQDEMKLAIAINKCFCIVVTHIDETCSRTLNSVLKTVGSPDARRVL